jgi:hypothetical protein
MALEIGKPKIQPVKVQVVAMRYWFAEKGYRRNTS